MCIRDRDRIETRDMMLEILPKHSIGAELGVFKGQFSDVILEVVKPSMLYLFDKFPKRARSGDKDGNNIEQVNLLEYYENVLVPKYRNMPNVTLLKLPTSEAERFADGHLDWCYIDADHSFEGVMKDLKPTDPVSENMNIINCLLYTSPSPRDRQKSRMPSSA